MWLFIAVVLVTSFLILIPYLSLLERATQWNNYGPEKSICIDYCKPQIEFKDTFFQNEVKAQNLEYMAYIFVLSLFVLCLFNYSNFLKKKNGIGERSRIIVQYPKPMYGASIDFVFFGIENITNTELE